MRCRECGEHYKPEDETRLDGEPLGMCEGCAEDYTHPAVDFAYWED